MDLQLDFSDRETTARSLQNCIDYIGGDFTSSERVGHVFFRLNDVDAELQAQWKEEKSKEVPDELKLRRLEHIIVDIEDVLMPLFQTYTFLPKGEEYDHGKFVEFLRR